MRRSSDLVYSFHMDALVRVLFVDVYATGVKINFEGNHHYLIDACGMTSFDMTGHSPTQSSVSVTSYSIKI